MLRSRQGKTREGLVGGFTEPERAVQRLPKPQGCCAGKSPFRASVQKATMRGCTVARKVLWVRKELAGAAEIISDVMTCM